MQSHRPGNTVARVVLALLLATGPMCAFAFPPRSGYDGDGASDVFWRNGSTGTNALRLTGDSRGYRAVGRVPEPSWHVVGQADFDGVGCSDLLWRNRATGRNVIWKSADFHAPIAVATVPDPSWNVAGIGDFDGDRRSDIFWRNSATGGYFLGDYQALASRGALFVPFFIRTNDGTTANRTDVFAIPTVSIASDAVADAPAGRPAAVASKLAMDAEFRRRVQSNLEDILRDRLPAWPGKRGPP